MGFRPKLLHSGPLASTIWAQVSSAKFWASGLHCYILDPRPYLLYSEPQASFDILLALDLISNFLGVRPHLLYSGPQAIQYSGPQASIAIQYSRPQASIVIQYYGPQASIAIKYSGPQASTAIF